MKPYFIKTSKIISHILYPSLYWKIPTQEKKIYITFDDGPTPDITFKVLDILDQYQAKATFFLIGDKVGRYPDIVQRLRIDGHAIGNHTFNHLNGWKNNNRIYFENIQKNQDLLNTRLYRPPYGKLKRSQLKILRDYYNIIMWTVLSADFDLTITPEQCYENVSGKAEPGSIIIFHDSEKAAERMLYALPRFLEEYQKQGYTFEAIDEKMLLHQS